MKVLLITGQLAEDSVKQYAKESEVETEVLALETAVAAFLTSESIADGLMDSKKDLACFNMILVPGLTRGDTIAISKTTGVPAFKGPKYAADLPIVLDLLCEVQFSTTISADEILREKFQQKALEEIKKVEDKRDELLKKPGTMLIGNVAVGKDFPMRVLAEIVDAAQMDKETIQKTAKRFENAGADIIDVGMVAGESQPQKAQEIVTWVKEVVSLPVSVDTLDPSEIKAAVEAGAELILSGDEGNIEEIAPYVRDTAIVLIPTNQRKGYFPKKAIDRVKYMEKIVAKAKTLGISHYIADLIIEPSEILESFIAFREFSKANPNIPLFVGISNVTELVDADSVGLNVILAQLSSEVGGNILLATEKSDKAKGTVAEDVRAAKMMFLSKKRSSPAKDLGINLLILKDKRKYEEPYNKELEKKAKVTLANIELESATLDSKGIFKISIDRDEYLIVATHYLSQRDEPTNIIKGKTAECIYSNILALELVSNYDHAAYLGSELAKAEIALRTGKDYVQDSGLFY